MIDRASSRRPDNNGRAPSSPVTLPALPDRRHQARLVVYAMLAALLVLAMLGCATETKPVATPTANAAVQTQKVPVEGGGAYTSVSASGLAVLLVNKKFSLVNVHVPYAGEIEPTDLFIPFDQIANRLNDLPQDKGARIILYCHSGSMSATAARELVKLGYTDIWNLDGGMSAWKAAGYPVVDKRR